MSRLKRFTFLCDKNERRLIAVLAQKLQRSQSDAVRFVVVSAARELAAQEDDTHPQRTQLNQMPTDELFHINHGNKR